MVETITNNYKNAKIKSIIKELIYKEQNLIKILTKYSSQKINFYGKIKQFQFGAIKTCKIPQINSINHLKYKFTKQISITIISITYQTTWIRLNGYKDG